MLIHSFSAYSALFSNQQITSAAMKALGIQDEEAWICWPWRQMTEWKGSQELEKTLARFHAEHAQKMIEKMLCPTEQKLELVDAAVKHLKAQQ